MRLRRRVVNSDIEKQVLIGFITSDKINHSLKGLFDPKLFQLNVGKIVSKWVKNYYALYNRSPKADIQEIFLAERHDLNPEDTIDIEKFLHSLSEQYLENPPNEDYLLDKAKVFLKKQSLLIGIKEANIILEGGNGDMAAISAAEAAIARSQKSAIESNKAIDLMSSETLISILEEAKNPLLVLREPMGTFMGPLHRGYLVGIMGSMKRGKTWMLQQMSTEAMENGLRVVFVSLEMPKVKIAKRFWQQLGCFGKEDGTYQFPVFDCQLNMYDKCSKSLRVCHTKKGESGYKICMECPEGRNKHLSTYLVPEDRPGMTSKGLMKVAKGWTLHHGKNTCRILSYPAFTANLSQIMNDIDVLEWREGYIPDVLAIDYPAILAPEGNQSSQNKEYVGIGDTWKTLKGIAEERQLLVFAPIQSDRSGTEANHLKIKNTAGYVQIIAHLDKCITLNQNEEDYEKRIMRIGKIADRWDDAYLSKEIRALTQLQCGQPLINGLILRKEMKEKN